jgi:hypothetical protein
MWPGLSICGKRIIRIAAIAPCIKLAVDANISQDHASLGITGKCRDSRLNLRQTQKVKKSDSLFTITRQPGPAGRQGNRQTEPTHARCHHLCHQDVRSADDQHITDRRWPASPCNQAERRKGRKAKVQNAGELEAQRE